MSMKFGTTSNLRSIRKIGSDMEREGTAQTTMTFTFPTGWQAGDLAIISAWWDSSITISTPTGWTSIVTNEDGSEYPEGETFYRILQSGDSGSVSVVSSLADYYSGVIHIFRGNVPISSVTIGNTAFADGPSALNSTIAADSPATVAANTVRLKLYFLTGRQQTTYIQNPIPTFTPNNWTEYFDGEAKNTLDHMDWSYKILLPGTVDASNQVTTNDTGRQGHHLASLTLS